MPQKEQNLLVELRGSWNQDSFNYMSYPHDKKNIFIGQWGSLLVKSFRNSRPWGTLIKDAFVGDSEIEADFHVSHGEIFLTSSKLGKVTTSTLAISKIENSTISLQSTISSEHLKGSIVYETFSNVKFVGEGTSDSKNYGGWIESRGQLRLDGVNFENFGQRGFNSEENYRSAIALQQPTGETIIKNCIIENSSNSGIFSRNAKNVEIIGIMLTNTVGDGIRLTGSVENFTISKSVIQNVRHRLLHPEIVTEGIKGESQIEK